MDLATVCYESCDACAPVNSINGLNALTFRVYPSLHRWHRDRGIPHSPC